MNIFDVLREERARHLEALAVIEGERQVSYRDLFASVESVAAELRSWGVGSTQTVALMCEDGTAYVVVSLAILSLRAVILPVSQIHSRDEVEAMLGEIDVSFFIFQQGLLPLNGSHLVSLRRLCQQDCLIERRVSRKDLPSEYPGMNPAFIRFSSGTTGSSKGVVLSHETIVARTDAADRGFNVTREDRIIWVLSMSYHFVASILLFLRRGAAIIVCCRGEFLSSLADAFIRHDPTFMYASPFHYSMMTSSALFTPEMLSNVRLGVSTAMRLPDADREKFYNKFGFRLTEAYGIIEVGLPCINRCRDLAKQRSVGPILPDYEVRIANPDAAGIGEVYVKGKGMFDAYFSPWQTRDQALTDGWFATGDLGRLDSDGFLFLSGRKKNVVNFAGMKVFPDEVESVLNQHPAIRESLVYGVAHTLFGELPCADIVIRDGTQPPPIDASEIRRFCYRYLAPYKVPKEFHCVPHLEKTASGKLRRWQRNSGG